MIGKRVTSLIMSFVFLSFTIMGVSKEAVATPTNTVKSMTTAPSTATVTSTATDKKVAAPVVTLNEKPYAEYAAGSNVYFKVASTTADPTTKVQYSAKLFNLDKNKPEMDIRNYGAAYYGAQIIAFSFTVKNPGNYRLAVFVKVNGTKGTNKAYYESYDNYVTNDFKVISSDKVVKANTITVAPLVATVEQKSVYKLPTTVNGKDSNKKTKKYNVTWDNPADTTTPGAVVFTGTISDPTTKAQINNTFAKLTLTITPLPVFEDINVSVDALSQYKLPTVINGKDSSNKTKKYDVTWDNKVNTTTSGAFTFLAKTVKDDSTKKVVKNVSPRLILTVLALPVFDTITATVNERDSFTLPLVLTGKLYDGTTKQFGVTWDNVPDTSTPGDFSFNGTIKDDKTSTIIKNVSAKLNLKVTVLPVFDSIVSSVAQGASYALPTTVMGKLYDGSTKQFSVTWDHKVNTSVPGIYTFIGTIKDTVTSAVVNNTQVVLTLTVNAVPVIAPIVDNVVQGGDYALPTSVTGTMYDGSTKNYNVTWDKPVDTSTPGTYTFTGTLKDANTSIVVPNQTVTLTLIVNQLALQAVATVNSQKSFKVTFNKQVDYSKSTIAATMNSIAIPLTVSWDNDGRNVLLQSQTPLAYGTYIIKILGVGLATDTYSVEVKAPTLASVSIMTAFVTPNNVAAKIVLAGKDQYGQSIDVAASDFMWIVTDTTAQVVLPSTASNENYINIQTSAPGIKAGDKVSVYGIGISNSAITLTSQIEVNTKAIDSLSLGNPVIPDGQNRIMVNTAPTYYEIPYTAVQNFTANGTVSQASAILDDLAETSLSQAVALNNFIFTTDKPDILKNIKVINGKLYVQVDGGKFGTAKLTATAIPAAGQTNSSISSININISGPSVPNSLALGQPSSVLVTGGAMSKLPITVFDQYGDTMSPDNFVKTNFTDFTILSSNTSVATASFDADGTSIDIVPVGVGSSNITLVNKNSGKPVVYQAIVNAASVVKDFSYKLDYLSMVKGASAKLLLNTLDQYGNNLSSAPVTYKYMVSAQNGNTNVNVSLPKLSVADAATTPIIITGVTPNKSEVITVTLYNDTNNNGLVDSGEIVKAYAFTENVVADNEPLIYSASNIPTVYAAVAQDRNNSGLNQDAYGAIQNQNNKNQKYAQKITVKATKTDGTPVALVNNPINSISVTINPDIIDYADKLGNDFVVVGRQWSGTDLDRDANIAVNYTDNNGLQKTLNAKVTVSKESLKATKLRAFVNTGNDGDTTNDVEITTGSCTVPLAAFQSINGKKMIENQNLVGVPVYFEVDDQYGVSSINPISISLVSKSTVFGTFTLDSYGVVNTTRFYNNESVTVSATDTEGHNLIVTIKTK